MASVDFTELLELADDLEAVARSVPKRVAQAVEFSARNVKDEARTNVRKRKYFKGAARTIDYELSGESDEVSSITAEVGYNLDRDGAQLGLLAEYGAPNAVAFMSVKDKDGKWKDVPVPGKPKRPLPPGAELQNALQAEEDGRLKGKGFQAGIEMAVDDAMKDSNL